MTAGAAAIPPRFILPSAAGPGSLESRARDHATSRIGTRDGTLDAQARTTWVEEKRAGHPKGFLTVSPGRGAGTASGSVSPARSKAATTAPSSVCNSRASRRPALG